MVERGSCDPGLLNEAVLAAFPFFRIIETSIISPRRKNARKPEKWKRTRKNKNKNV